MESPHYIWQNADWPNFRFEESAVAAELALAHHAYGSLEGKLASLGFDVRRELDAEAWTQDALSTAAIEGEHLDLLAVRSSVARRLGVAIAPGSPAPRDVDGLLDIMEDAVVRANQPLTHERLHAWQAALFPTGYSGMRRLRAGAYREHGEPMQVVSGRVGHETVHYEAPPSGSVSQQMNRFLAAFNESSRLDPLLQAALAHLWFETLHPFEDGNGRIGRVIVDLVLARQSPDTSRLVRLSQQLLERRTSYYEELQHAQHGGMDVTRWVNWFVNQLRLAFERASGVLDRALEKARFWTLHRDKTLTARQRKVVNLLLDAGPGNFEGGMSTRKYQSLAATSRATASRELIELVASGLLRVEGGGRSTRYEIVLDPSTKNPA
jgi:Fic family protein